MILNAVKLKAFKNSVANIFISFWNESFQYEKGTEFYH